MFSLRSMGFRSALLIGLLVPLSLAPALPVGAEGNAAAAADSVAQRLLAADASDSDAADAVSEALAWAGIATHHSDGSVRPGIAPTLPMHVIDNEVGLLAADARAHQAGTSRLTLAQLGSTLRDMGWSVSEAANPGNILAQVLGQTIRDARQAPQGPQSFSPLFIAALERAAAPDLDLASGSFDPSRLQLSLLEAELILAMHLRSDTTYPEPLPPAAAPHANAVEDDNSQQVAAAAPESMCGDALKKLGDFETPARLGLGVAGSKLSPMDKVYEKLNLTKMEKFAASHVMDTAKLVAQLNNITFALDAVPDQVHHSHGGESNTVQFIALAQAPAPTQDPELLALYDCLNAIGYPAPDDPRAQYSSWKVAWDLSGLSGHAQVSLDENQFDFPGHQVAHLSEGGGASIVVDMLSEPEDVHQTGIERSGTFSMSAHLETDQVPLNALVDAAQSDLPGALLDIASGFYQLVGGPTVVKQVAVTWHEPRQDAGTITFDLGMDDNQPLTAQKNALPTFGRTSLSTGLHNTLHRHEVAHLGFDGHALLDGQFEFTSVQLLQDRGRQACSARDSVHDWSVDATTTIQEKGSVSQVPITWQVSTLPDGTYRLSYSGVSIPTTIDNTTHRVGSDPCRPQLNGTHDSSEHSASSREPVAAQVTGTVDPEQPNVFRGTSTRTQPELPGSPTTTITWDVAPP